MRYGRFGRFGQSYLIFLRKAISVDDTVIEKIYSDPKNAELISYFLSGKAHKTIIDLNLITLYSSNINGNLVPINYIIYDKKDGKTKNDYLREMVSEIINWGVKPKIVTGDCWYSGVENLKFLKNQKLFFCSESKKTGQYQMSHIIITR